MTRETLKPRDPYAKRGQCDYSKTGWSWQYEDGACRCDPCPPPMAGSMTRRKAEMWVPGDGLGATHPSYRYRAHFTSNPVATSHHHHISASSPYPTPTQMKSP